MERLRQLGLDKRFLRLFLTAAIATPVISWVIVTLLQQSGNLPPQPGSYHMAKAAVVLGVIMTLLALPLVAIIWVLMQELLTSIKRPQLRAMLSVFPIIPVLCWVFGTLCFRLIGFAAIRSDTIVTAIALACLIASITLIAGSFVYFRPRGRSVRS